MKVRQQPYAVFWEQPNSSVQVCEGDPNPYRGSGTSPKFLGSRVVQGVHLDYLLTTHIKGEVPRHGDRGHPDTYQSSFDSTIQGVLGGGVLGDPR